MSAEEALGMDRVKALKERLNEINRELDLLSGHRGPCSNCGEEAAYANYSSTDPLLCSKCWDEKRIAEARPTYVHLIGLRVEDVIISSGYYPFRGLKLEGGHVVEAESDHDGDPFLDLTPC